MIVAFEGLDGAGKETQSRMVADMLNQEGHKVFLYHFPAYKGPFYEIYQKITGMEIPTDSKNRLIQHLFAEDMRRVMLKHRQHENEIVLLDRYEYSTYVYGQALGLGSTELAVYTQNLPAPDLVIYLRLEAANARVTGHFADEVQRYAEERYDSWARNARWVTIDATGNIMDVFGECIRAVKSYLPQNA